MWIVELALLFAFGGFEASAVSDKPNNSDDTSDADKKKAAKKARSKKKPSETDKGSPRTKCRKKDTKAERKACEKARKTHWRTYPHQGLILEANGGAAMCWGSVCRKNLKATPGPQAGAMMAANVLGWVELGADISWSSMSLNVAGNPLAAHGVDPGRFAYAASGIEDGPESVAIDLSALEAGEGKARLLNTAVTARFHLLPAGPWSVYIGSGLGFSRWRAMFDVDGGAVDIRLAGFSIPALVGVDYYPMRFLAITFQVRHLATSMRQLALQAPTFEGKAVRSAIENWDALTVDWGLVKTDMPQVSSAMLGVKLRL